MDENGQEVKRISVDNRVGGAKQAGPPGWHQLLPAAIVEVNLQCAPQVSGSVFQQKVGNWINHTSFKQKKLQTYSTFTTKFFYCNSAHLFNGLSS